MKKFVFAALTVCLALAATSFICIEANADASAPVTESVSEDTVTCGNVCDCGGKLEWTATAYTVTVKCYSCGGDGVLGSGSYKQKCNLCNGTGRVKEWRSGYRCKSCGKVYSDK